MFVRYENRTPVNLELVRFIDCKQISARSISPPTIPNDCTIVFVFTSGQSLTWNFPNPELTIAVYDKIMDNSCNLIEL